MVGFQHNDRVNPAGKTILRSAAALALSLLLCGCPRPAPRLDWPTHFSAASVVARWHVDESPTLQDRFDFLTLREVQELLQRQAWRRVKTRRIRTAPQPSLGCDVIITGSDGLRISCSFVPVDGPLVVTCHAAGGTFVATLTPADAQSLLSRLEVKRSDKTIESPLTFDLFRK